ncbi:MAG TPA: hypothetical protein VFG09_12395 [Thermodesulfovibrionales bacterium]|nr:hypothetical protein [Thermodesulfovibrionales bacterium]
MWQRVKDNLDSGVGKIKWFSSLLNDRMKIEISLVRLLYQSAEMERKRAGLMKVIGERVYELKNGPDKRILRDAAILEALRNLERMDADIEDVKKRAAEISRLEV